MRTEIDRIPPVLREVLVLKDMEELPTAEVAERLSLTVAAVKSRGPRGKAAALRGEARGGSDAGHRERRVTEYPERKPLPPNGSRRHRAICF
jgi:sigma-70-like protein